MRSCAFHGSLALATFALATIAGLAPLGNAASKQTAAWSSSFHPFQITWGLPWVQLVGTNSADSETEMTQGFLNRQGRMSYLIRITPDVPQDQLPDEEYRSLLKEQQLSAHESCRLIDEGPGMLHGLLFHRIRIRSRGTFGEVCTYVYSRRDGQRSTTVHMAFPYDDKLVAAGRLPQDFAKLQISLDKPAEGS
jgi:hypothetical protein